MRKGVSVTDSLAVLGVQTRLVVREGAFPPLCPHQTLSSQWAHLPVLELRGDNRFATKHFGFIDRSGQILVSVFCTPGSAPEAFSWPDFSLTTPCPCLAFHLTAAGSAMMLWTQGR